ncbi:MAG: septal ring lytic transglycosylase RlpA family protein [Bacteroidaceae bacterium]|nr:septal ring lytic transglycosylase RlpA family protein [Bacteroidaceae bacterium]
MMTRKALLILLCFLPLLTMAQKPFEEDGEASYYGSAWHGRRTADGGIYDKDAHICAHKTLPFGTRIKVTNKKNGKFTIVTVTDRGPYGPGRIVDLSNAGARDIDIITAGVAPVHLEVLPPELEVSVDSIMQQMQKRNLMLVPLLETQPTWRGLTLMQIDSLAHTFGKRP